MSGGGATGAIEGPPWLSGVAGPQPGVAIAGIGPSACPGVGAGTGLIAVASGPGAAFVLTTACMVLGRLGDWGTGGLGEEEFRFNRPPGRRARRRVCGPIR